MKAVIHSTGLPWQQRYARYLKEGFKRHGFEVIQTAHDHPVDCTVPVLLGPNYWRRCEREYSNFLQVNRKFIGDINDVVTIGWNGFNGRGIFCVDEIDVDRSNRWLKDVTLEPWRVRNNGKILILGQHDNGRANESLETFYESSKKIAETGQGWKFRKWPGTRPLADDLCGVEYAVTLNSTVIIDLIIQGVPTVALDEGSPGWNICGPGFNANIEPPRMEWLRYLTMCQYHYTEIQNGYFWEWLRYLTMCQYHYTEIQNGYFWDRLSVYGGERLCDVRF